jgi:hypothetical protein
LKRTSLPKLEDDDGPIKKSNSSSKNVSTSDEDEDLFSKKKKVKSSIENENSYITGVDLGKIWVMNLECPNNCSRRGICLNSTCFCDQG